MTFTRNSPAPACPSGGADDVRTRHHIDRRAADLVAEATGDPHDLLTTSELSEWTGLVHTILRDRPIARLRPEIRSPLDKAGPLLEVFRRGDLAEGADMRQAGWAVAGLEQGVAFAGGFQAARDLGGFLEGPGLGDGECDVS